MGDAHRHDSTVDGERGNRRKAELEAMNESLVKQKTGSSPCMSTSNEIRVSLDQSELKY